jgi:hypothetical protein
MRRSDDGGVDAEDDEGSAGAPTTADVAAAVGVQM